MPTKATIATALIAPTLDEARGMMRVLREEMESLYRRAEGLVRLTVAEIAGVIAIIGLITTSSTDLGRTTFSGFAIGALFLFVALLVFVSVISGFPRPIVLDQGPRIDTLIRNMTRTDWDRARHDLSILLSLRDASESFRIAIRRLAARLTVGIHLAIIATATLLATLALILGGSIDA